MEPRVHLPVTRCVCHELDFAALKDLARTMNFDFDQLRAWSGVCTGCGTSLSQPAGGGSVSSCPRCSAASPAGARFCQKCGMALQAAGS